jgi:hypothetical protein
MRKCRAGAHGISVAQPRSVYRSFIGRAVIGSVLIASAASAQTTTLLAASDASQIEALKVAKVMASDSSFWLGVQLRGKARLALVTADSAVEFAPAAEAWLRALDFTTRVRVAPPPGPRSSCGLNDELGLADTGIPEPPVVDVKRVEAVSSELELRRALEDAGLQVDSERIALFANAVPAPFRVSLYDVPESGGQTAALRLLERGNASGAPRIEIVGRDAVPLNFIGLATAAVLPPEASTADPSEFPVTFRAADTTIPSSDYLSARASWLLDHPERWLVETRNSASVFAWTVFPPKAQLAPVVARYFQGLSGPCPDQVQDAHAHGSQQAAEYQCDDHDDLSLSLAQLGFGELRLSRLYGSLGADGIALRVIASDAHSPLLSATDIDARACPTTGGTPTTGGGMSSPEPQPPVVVNDPGPGGYYEPDPGTPVYTDDGGCNLTIVDSESCSGDSSSSDSSSGDSCSGNSSASDSNSSDSCSGDSSSDDGGPDSCSGDSSSNSSADSCSGESDSSSDSSGCSKDDGYNGDTCSGNSHSSSEAAQTSSAELRSDSAARSHRPRRVHLSLLTLLAAALALPFRRLRTFRF